MHALDGNAIAGALSEYFDAEMTTAWGSCAHCGAQSEIAELVVYLRAPGAVVRCRGCGAVVFVLVKTRGSLRLEGRGFRLRDAPPSTRPGA
jgi:DNA-directed RNA polymerase subunit RPC12/RpoP